MHIVEFRRTQGALMPVPAVREDERPSDRSAAAAVIGKARAAGRTMLSEAEGKVLLKAYGIPVAETVAATDADAAVNVAEPMLAVGQSVVVKVLSDDITHKSDIGGVASTSRPQRRSERQRAQSSRRPSDCARKPDCRASRSRRTSGDRARTS